MRLIKHIAPLLLALCVNTESKAWTNPECLKHLGGGFSDTECYTGLANAFKAKNKILYDDILKTIPNGDPHRKLLAEYMASQEGIVRFCALAADASASWKSNPSGTEYPAIKAKCVYDFRRAQNSYLNDILKNTD